jgi:hypothetical protein
MSFYSHSATTLTPSLAQHLPQQTSASVWSSAACLVSSPYTSSAYTNTRSENIAFLIRHNQNSYGKPVLASDVSLVSPHYGLLLAGKADKAGVGIFVIGSGYTHNLMRVHVGRGEGEGMVDRLTEYVD